ncbi:MAG: hypothetical protein ABR976_03140 [Terracidiphilus sp.]
MAFPQSFPGMSFSPRLAFRQGGSGFKLQIDVIHGVNDRARGGILYAWRFGA